jgi:hypothetical protein
VSVQPHARRYARGREGSHARRPCVAKGLRETHTHGGCLRRVYVRSSTRAHRACMPFIKDECRRVSTYCVMVGTETRKRERERQGSERGQARSSYVHRAQAESAALCGLWACGDDEKRHRKLERRLLGMGLSARHSATTHTTRYTDTHTHK